MEVSRSRLEKGTSEGPSECQTLIDKLESRNRQEFIVQLRKVDTWTFEKCELNHWIVILDTIINYLVTDTQSQR